MSYNDIRAAVIKASLDVQKKGLIRGTSGNISLRSEDGKVIAITPSSIPYEDLTPEMIPLVDSDGNIVEGDTKPSSELPMHLAVMRARPDVNAVVHTHSKFSTILSIIDEPLPVCTIPLIMYAPNPAPIMPFEFPGSQSLGESAVKGLGDRGSAVILAMHGLLTVGKTLDKALTCTEYIEEGAEIAVITKLATGETRGIPQEKIKEMIQILMSGRAL